MTRTLANISNAVFYRVLQRHKSRTHITRCILQSFPQAQFQNSHHTLYSIEFSHRHNSRTHIKRCFLLSFPTGTILELTSHDVPYRVSHRHNSRTHTTRYILQSFPQAHFQNSHYTLYSIQFSTGTLLELTLHAVLYIVFNRHTSRTHITRVLFRVSHRHNPKTHITRCMLYSFQQTPFQNSHQPLLYYKSTGPYAYIYTT